MYRNMYLALPPSLQAVVDYLYYFPKYRQIRYPAEIGLGLSVNCQGRCLYCPTHRSKRIHESRNMSLRLAEKVVQDLSAHHFAGTINISENGEALLNPYASDILRLVSRQLPDCEVSLFTNMNSMDETMAQKILDGGVQWITVCIDGASEQTYKCMKGLDFIKLRKNMHALLTLRNNGNYTCKIVIYVISASAYHENILKNQSPYPDDTQEVIAYWSRYLCTGDVVAPTPVLGYWALPNEDKPENRSRCMHFDQISTKMIIAPNGTAYLCCIDDNIMTGYGNIANQSIGEVWNSRARSNLLRNVLLRRYKQIGEPCLHCAHDVRLAS